MSPAPSQPGPVHWKSSGYPVEELEWLSSDFRLLDPLTPGIGERIMQFVATGHDAEVLQTLAGMRAASGGLALRCRGEIRRETTTRSRFFSSTTILDPAFHRRLALVYDAAAAQNSAATGSRGRVPVAAGLQGGAEFIDAYLWEALQVNPNVYPRHPKPSRLSALEMERMLELHGTPAAWLVRGALLFDPTSWGWMNNAAGFIPAIPGFAESLVRHVGMVRECLEQSDHRGRIHCIELLHRKRFSPAHCPDAAARQAVHSSKGVREAAEAWIALEPGPVIPHLLKIASDAGPAERFEAVKLLAKIGGDEATVFLKERLGREKSARVREFIEGFLDPQSRLDAAEEGDQAGSLELPELPEIRVDEPLEDSILEDLRALMDRTNAEWLAEWEKMKAQRWAPKSPVQFPPGTAEHWFELLGTLESGIHPQKSAVGDRFHPTGALLEFAGHPKFQLVHVIRWMALINRNLFTERNHWIGPGIQCLDAWIEKHGPAGYREIAAICQQLRFQSDWIARAWLMRSEYNSGPFIAQAGEQVWPYFAERLGLLEKALGWVPDHGDLVPKYWESNFRANAWRALATFPVPPPSLLDRMWETALGSGKIERALAQEALKRAPNREARLMAALASGQKEQRTVAAEWIGRLKLEATLPALRAAIAKEKYDAPKAAMIGAMERLGVAPDEFLDRDGLLNEARVITAKAPPAALAWFPMEQLPAVHWSDNGTVVAPEILRAWLIQACKLKQAEPSALVRRYAASFRAAERETLGRFILEAWMAEDVKPHPRAVAEQNAMKTAQAIHQAAQQYPEYYQAYAGLTLEQVYAGFLAAHLEQPGGSAIDSKGILAVAGACVGADAAEPVARYLKKWYGTRVHQAKALLQMLAWVDHPAATQTLLAIGTRFRTRSLQEEATRLAHEIAGRKGWSLAELADRTIPTAGLDEVGVLELDFGPRRFTARLNAELDLVLHDPEGRPIKTLPEPRRDDDAGKAAAAKKQLAATRKELKQVLEQQRTNLYEAMCVQRTWRFEDWEPCLCRHPVVRHFCQRLVWTARRGELVLQFRPLADGTFTDVEDNPLTLEPGDEIALAHRTTVSAESAAGWLGHLSDYAVAPLFDQFGRGVPEMTPEKKKQRELTDFEGWMSDTFRIRGRATKLGYTRGSTGDGGWFHEYVKRFPTTGVVATIEFTGSALPESNIPAALLKLSFQRENAGHGNLLLGDVPAVLLAECWNDFRQIATDGSGFDADWAKKVSL